MNEIWKPVIGYEGLYEVSNQGRVRSIDRLVRARAGKSRKVKGIILNASDHGNGYLHVKLSNGKSKTYLVHRLVASAFIPNPRNFVEINHKDENPRNNRADNLEWCNRTYNLTYGERSTKATQTRWNRGSYNPKNFKPIAQYTTTGKLVQLYPGIKIASEQGFSYTGIISCAHLRTHTCGGYVWRYVSADRLKDYLNGESEEGGAQDAEGNHCTGRDILQDAGEL